MTIKRKITEKKANPSHRATHCVTFALCVSLFILSSCDVKTPIYDLGQGIITLSTNWDNRGADVEKPASYLIAVDTHQEEAKTDLHTLKMAFTPGNYMLYVYNAAGETSVTNGTANIQPVDPPHAAQGEYIHPLPGWLFTSALPINVQADTNHEFVATMHQQIRELTLMLIPDSGIGDNISGITASLSGVASAWNLLDNQPTGNPANVAITFTRINEGENTGNWIGTVRLLGTIGSAQQLSTTVTLASPTPSSFTVNSNMSVELIDFNLDKKEPLRIRSNLNVIEGIITDWEKVPQIPITTE